MKIILKPKILKTFSAKCDNFETPNTTIFFNVMIFEHSCITKPLLYMHWNLK
jgi:hypothetical protein